MLVWTDLSYWTEVTGRARAPWLGNSFKLSPTHRLILVRVRTTSLRDTQAFTKIKMATAVSPFARSSAFEESLLSAREQTVRQSFPIHISLQWLYQLYTFFWIFRSKKCTVYQRAFWKLRWETHKLMVSSSSLLCESPVLCIAHTIINLKQDLEEKCTQIMKSSARSVWCSFPLHSRNYPLYPPL